MKHFYEEDEKKLRQKRKQMSNTNPLNWSNISRLSFVGSSSLLISNSKRLIAFLDHRYRLRINVNISSHISEWNIFCFISFLNQDKGMNRAQAQLRRFERREGKKRYPNNKESESGNTMKNQVRRNYELSRQALEQQPLD